MGRTKGSEEEKSSSKKARRGREKNEKKSDRGREGRIRGRGAQERGENRRRRKGGAEQRGNGLEGSGSAPRACQHPNCRRFHPYTALPAPSLALRTRRGGPAGSRCGTNHAAVAERTRRLKTRTCATPPIPRSSPCNIKSR